MKVKYFLNFTRSYIAVNLLGNFIHLNQYQFNRGGAFLCSYTHVTGYTYGVRKSALEYIFITLGRKLILWDGPSFAVRWMRVSAEVPMPFICHLQRRFPVHNRIIKGSLRWKSTRSLVTFNLFYLYRVNLKLCKSLKLCYQLLIQINFCHSSNIEIKQKIWVRRTWIV